MTKRLRYEVEISVPAANDVAELLDWTVKYSGNTAAIHYELLIDQAIQDLAADPLRRGVKVRDDLQSGLCLYHLQFSRKRVSPQQSVRAPRHLVMFRHLNASSIEILHLIHERRDLKRHLPT